MAVSWMGTLNSTVAADVWLTVVWLWAEKELTSSSPQTNRQIYWQLVCHTHTFARRAVNDSISSSVFFFFLSLRLIFSRLHLCKPPVAAVLGAISLCLGARQESLAAAPAGHPSDPPPLSSSPLGGVAIWLYLVPLVPAHNNRLRLSRGSSHHRLAIYLSVEVVIIYEALHKGCTCPLVILLMPPVYFVFDFLLLLPSGAAIWGVMKWNGCWCREHVIHSKEIRTWVLCLFSFTRKCKLCSNCNVPGPFFPFRLDSVGWRGHPRPAWSHERPSGLFWIKNKTKQKLCRLVQENAK